MDFTSKVRSSQFGRISRARRLIFDRFCVTSARFRVYEAEFMERHIVLQLEMTFEMLQRLSGQHVLIVFFFLSDQTCHLLSVRLVIRTLMTSLN